MFISYQASRGRQFYRRGTKLTGDPCSVDALAKFCNDDPAKGPVPVYTMDPDKDYVSSQMSEIFAYNGQDQFCFAAGRPGSGCGYWGCQAVGFSHSSMESMVAALQGTLDHVFLRHPENEGQLR